MKQVPQSIYYNTMNENEKEEYLGYIERKIKRDKKKTPVLYEMYKIVKNNVENHRADFYLHDYNTLTIETEGSNQFVWVVNNCGTHIVRLDNNFEEERVSRITYFNSVKYHFSSKTDLVYIVDLEKGLLKSSSFEDITEDVFTNKYGTVKEYFEKQTKDFTYEHHVKVTHLFTKLMEEYRNHPPKRLVDAIINNPPKRTFEFVAEGYVRELVR